MDHLKEVAREGDRIEREAHKFLKMISRKEEASDYMLDDVDRYLSRDNVADGKRVAHVSCRMSRKGRMYPPGWIN